MHACAPRPPNEDGQPPLSTMNSKTLERAVRFEGAKNVRDLGGLPTRSGALTQFGRVYRGDGLSRLTDADLTTLANLKLGSIIDLRHTDEIERAPDRLPPDNPPTHSILGFFPSGSRDMFERVNSGGLDAHGAFEIMCKNYSRFPFEHAPEFRVIMHLLLEPDVAPCLIHCTSGKDRTGIIAAFILLAIGVPLDAVVADYEMSGGDRPPVDLFARSASAGTMDMIMAAKAEYILAAVEGIETRSGSFDQYLSESLGFGTRERNALEALMLN